MEVLDWNAVHFEENAIDLKALFVNRLSLCCCPHDIMTSFRLCHNFAAELMIILLMKRILKTAWVLSLIFVFSTFLFQDVLAGEKKDVDFQGKWKEGGRSLSHTIPISAFVDGKTFFLHSETQRSDVRVCILKCGETIYEETIPASMTDRFTVDLTRFERGSYIVELENQWGDFLVGSIVVEI